MKNHSQDLSIAWQVALLTLLCAVAIMVPDMSYAEDTVIGNTLCKVVGWFTGNTGKGIATIAIIVIGVGALMGKVSWGMAIIVGIGVAIIFGASSLVKSISDGGDGCTGVSATKTTFIDHRAVPVA